MQQHMVGAAHPHPPRDRPGRRAPRLDRRRRRRRLIAVEPAKALRALAAALVGVGALVIPGNTPASAAVTSVVFNTGVSVPGREETVWITADATGTVDLSIDFDGSGTFEASELVLDGAAVADGVNSFTYEVPTGPAFAAGDTTAEVTSQPDGGTTTVPRIMADAADDAAVACPADTVPVPAEVIPNDSFEIRTGDYLNDDADNTIVFAEDWFDSHPTGGQYLFFDPPAFDSGPAEATMPVRAGADGQAFFGGHSSAGEVGEGATNTLLVPLAPGTTYVGYLSAAAGGYGREGDGFVEVYGTDDIDMGHVAGAGVVAPTPANSELLDSLDTVDFAGAGVRPSWSTRSFVLDPTEAWPYLRFEVRNANPADDGTTAGQAWLNIDDIHLFECGPLQDYGDAPDVFGTTFTADGPRHTLIDYDDVAQTSSLMLGATVDGEADGQPSPFSDGDDADEDGVAEPIVLLPGTENTVTVSVTNTNEGAATLVGWIDLDNSGVFDDDEWVSASIPGFSGTADYDLEFPAPTSSAALTARFRLFLGDVAEPLALGPADAGEVEDYPVEVAAPQSLFAGCASLITFDDDNEDWRAATTSGGFTVVLDPEPVGWDADAGNPGGGVIEQDLDGNWSELWTPEFAANGYSSDYLEAIGTSVQFDYRNDTGIDYDVYVAVQGTNGDRVFFVFRSQIVDSTEWTRIRVPLDADQWLTGFDNGTGPVGPTATDAEFEAIMADVDHFAFSIEGQSGADLTAFDNFGSSCDDLGDAPDSYGTLVSSGGPIHRATDLNEGTGVAPLMLGDTVDIEDNGAPTPDASGDAADDGVAGPLAVTPDGSTTMTVDVTNGTGEAATLVGWVDLDGSGTFDDDELETVAVDASGPYDLTFAAATATPATTTFARFRLSPGSVDVDDMEPGGYVEGGEVEDYAVAVYASGVTKTAGEVTTNADGTHTLVYTVTVSRTGDGPAYDLTDTLLFGDAVTVGAPPPMVTSADVSVDDLVDDWDAGSDTLTIAEDVVIADGEVDVFTVTVNVTVDAGELTFANSDCTLDDDEDGTGFTNSATAITGGVELTEVVCRAIAVPTVEKTLVADPLPVGQGIWEVEYEVVVTNVGAAATTYDLVDVPTFGAPVAIDGIPLAAPATPATAWDPITSTLTIANDLVLEAGTSTAPATDTYAVIYQFSMMATTITFANSDCTLAGGEAGTGLLNTATMTVGAFETVVDACGELPGAPLVTKSVTSSSSDGDGTYATVYTLTVTNPGAGPGVYDLEDELLYAVGVDVLSVSVENTIGDVEVDPSWDGSSNTRVATGVEIGAGTAEGPALHEFVVSVVATVPPFGEAHDADCQLSKDESAFGTGLMNWAAAITNEIEQQSVVCEPFVLLAGGPDGELPGDGRLPSTGSDPRQPVTIALVFTMLGGFSLAAGRRRRLNRSGRSSV